MAGRNEGRQPADAEMPQHARASNADGFRFRSMECAARRL